MDATNIITLIGFMVIGAVIKSFVDSSLNRKQNLSQKQYDFKETRYKALIMLMLAMLDFEKNQPMLKEHGRNFGSINELSDEIRTERNNMILFASDEVITSLKNFLRNPNEQTFFDTAVHMRKDLYKLKTKLKIEDLNI
jgi:hypothetical protein